MRAHLAFGLQGQQMIHTAFASRAKSKSLVRSSLELGRVLADRNGITFRAKGTCMYPTIRAGDVLRILSCRATEVSVGDIAVPKAGFLFAHRVIATGMEKGRAYIVTRPDIARVGSDGPMFDESLLGRVAAIERNGRTVPLHSGAQPWPVRGYHALRLGLIKAAQPLRAGAGSGTGDRPGRCVLSPVGVEVRGVGAAAYRVHGARPVDGAGRCRLSPAAA